MNLVPNPGFKDAIFCPDSFNRSDWIIGNNAVLQNFYGNQNTLDGGTYLSFSTFRWNISNIRKYLTCQLLNSLQIGRRHLISNDVSLARGFGKQISCNKLVTSSSTGNFETSIGNSAVAPTVNTMILGNNDVKVGIGLSGISGGPLRKLEITDGTNPQLRLSNVYASVFTDFTSTSMGDLVINPQNNGLAMNVGINTIAPQTTLDVNGAITAKQIIIESINSKQDLLTLITHLQNEVAVLKQQLTASIKN